MIVVSIKLAALGIAVAIISIFVYYYGFNNYVAIAGIAAYIIAKAVLWIPRAMILMRPVLVVTKTNFYYRIEPLRLSYTRG